MGASPPNLAQQIRRIEATGKAVSEKATLLSNIIEAVCEQLEEIPGKTEVSVGSEFFALSFERFSDGWGVRVHESDGHTGGVTALQAAPVDTKAKAFPLLFELLSEIERKQNERLELLEQALQRYPGKIDSKAFANKEAKQPAQEGSGNDLPF